MDQAQLRTALATIDEAAEKPPATVDDLEMTVSRIEDAIRAISLLEQPQGADDDLE